MSPETAVEKLSEMNLREVSRNTGIPYDRMAKWKQGKGLPKPKDLKILEDYLSGKSSISNIKKTPKEKEAEGIPLIPIGAMAGFGQGEMSVLDYDCERYVIPSFRGADFLIAVKGTSMYPKYNSGDIVACKKLNIRDIFFQWNKVYVIDTDQGPLIKRIKRGKDEDYIQVVSENPDFDPFELPISKVYSIALVIGCIRME